MKRRLRLLIVEDREDDAELILLELRRGGFDLAADRVDTAEAMSAALDQTWDAIISDWSMPRFSAMAAYAMVKDRGIDLPFIIVSGTIGEETAVSAMKIGVHDFMSKGHLSRLIPAIERELREVENRRQARKMREQLLISERMASVGTLAAGVAHEINNPLGTLIGNAEFATGAMSRVAAEMKRWTERDGAAPPPGDWRAFLTWSGDRIGEVREALDMMQEAAERMRLVVGDLRVFSHPGEDRAHGPVDLGGVLESALRMASTEIRHRAQLVRDYQDVPPVFGNEAPLGQIFLNLFVNAAQAIPEGRVSSNKITVTVRQNAPERVLVEIRDTGAGIPDEIVSRIFDPFFTTKASGLGTGLGLAICHRLVTALGGEIAVKSTVGEGTVFTVSLPVAHPTTEKSAPPDADGSAPVRARILLVDDETRLRLTIRRMLESRHDVLDVGSAKEALDIISGGRRFDIILCDLMMPEMTGMDLHAELERLTPDQAAKMAFVTGGAFSESVRTFLERVPNASIEKPFRSSAILAFVDKLMRA
jgi:signal transduction histidine kinase